MHTNQLRVCKNAHSVWIWMILAAVLGSLAEKCKLEWKREQCVCLSNNNCGIN